MPAHPVLIVGSTGKTGRRIVHRLRARQIEVREASRGAATPFDWDRPQTWPGALRGVEHAYIAYAPDLAVPGAPDQIAAFAEAAVQAGVKRLVLLSGRNEPQAQRCEAIVQSSGAQTTCVRASWFSQNFSEGVLCEAVRAGVIALPASDVVEPFVDADDIADVAVAALTEAGHEGRVYELTGPRLLSFADAADEISRACRRPVRYESLDSQAFLERMTPVVGAAVAGMLTHLFAEVLDGRNACLASGVQEALGRAPRDFADYCAAAAMSGAWDVRQEGRP